MQIIIISGPSGSGKTTLSGIILNKVKDGIILNTDNYYRTGIISKILSKIISSYFDRIISFDIGLFNSDLEFILKNGFSKFSYKYNFKSKSKEKIYKNTNNIKFIIIEGIFGQEILKSLSKNNCILIKLEVSKQTCMRRVLQRDFIERGKRKEVAQKEFIKAWKLYLKNKKINNSKSDIRSIVIRKKSEINPLLKKIVNIVN